MRNNRETNLQEFAVSLTTGGLAAMVLCLMLPGIESKVDILAFMPIFWFMATTAIWTGLDIKDRINQTKAEARQDEWDALLNGRKPE